MRNSIIRILASRRHPALGTSLVALLWVAVAIGSVPNRAAAYCLARSCDPDAATCSRDAQTGCSTEGPQLFRRNGCVYFAVQQGAAQRTFKLTDPEFADALQAAFDAWSSVDCDGEGPPSVKAQYVGAAPITRPFACASAPEYNVDTWFVRDDLTMVVTTSSGATAGITHTSFVDETGEIYDADVSLNELWFLVQDEADIMDYLHVVAMHEAGHALGLAHSQDENALMYRDYRVSADRTLTEDDIEGICALYPPMALECGRHELPASAVDPAACKQAQSQAEHDQEQPVDAGSEHETGASGACNVTAVRGGTSSLWITTLAGVLLGLVRRRHRALGRARKSAVWLMFKTRRG